MSERCEPPLDDSTDDAPAETVMAALVCCFLSWEPDARVLGNVRSADAVRAIREMWGKANTPVTPPATVAALVEALEWMITNDDTNEGDTPMPELGGQTWDEFNAYWIEGLNRARAALALYREAGR